jgi:nitrous oxidase accessory protein NosD
VENMKKIPSIFIIALLVITIIPTFNNAKSDPVEPMVTNLGTIILRPTSINGGLDGGHYSVVGAVNAIAAINETVANNDASYLIASDGGWHGYLGLNFEDPMPIGTPVEVDIVVVWHYNSGTYNVNGWGMTNGVNFPSNYFTPCAILSTSYCQQTFYWTKRPLPANGNVYEQGTDWNWTTINSLTGVLYFDQLSRVTQVYAVVKYVTGTTHDVWVNTTYNSSTLGWMDTCFNRIQDAVYICESGGTTHLDPGTYSYEMSNPGYPTGMSYPDAHVRVWNKAVNIVGSGKNITILDNGNAGTGVFFDTGANGSSISDLTIHRFGNDYQAHTWITEAFVGIKVWASHITISDVAIYDFASNGLNVRGIHIWSSSNVNIHGCYISDLGWNSIEISRYYPTTYSGLHGSAMTNIKITDSVLNSNSYAIYCQPFAPETLGDNVLVQNNHITKGQTFLYFPASTNITADNNLMAGGGTQYGIYWRSGGRCTNNSISGFTYGLWVMENFETMNHQVISGNRLHDNSVGIQYRSDSGTLNGVIYNNMVYSNTNNHAGNPGGIWSITEVPGINIIGGSYLGGNYWGDYTGADFNEDGIGDVSFIFSSGTDYFPLVYYQYVINLNTSEAFANLNAAIDDTNTVNGNILLVKPNHVLYQPYVEVDKQVTIKGYSFTNTTVSYIGSPDGIFNIVANNVNIFNLTICNADDYGINIQTQNVHIEGNYIYSNAVSGIYIWGDNNVISGNYIMGNGVGIGLYSWTADNLIYNNCFNNTVNVVDDGTNRWNITKTAGENIYGGSYLGGNYWSDYAGIDNTDDGLGDTFIPYDSLGNIATGGDYHPLINTLAVLTVGATNIGKTDAVIHGFLLDGGGESCTVYFEYGFTTSYGNVTASQSTTSWNSFTATLNTLQQGKIYHYRAYAENTRGNDYGDDMVFSTNQTITHPGQTEQPPVNIQKNETVIIIPPPEPPKYTYPAFTVPEMYQLLHADKLPKSNAEVTVMVIDTGVLPITYNNIQLNRISAIKGISLSNQYDENGHGTWVNYAVAYLLQTKLPNAKQISYRVFGAEGSCSGTEFINAIETAKKMHVDIVSISAGILGSGDTALLKACDDLRNEGIIVVCAAGNFGPSPGSIASPGVSDSVIAVAASDPIETGMYSTETHMRGVFDLHDDIICPWSSRGPVTGVQKPDVTAPGESILGPWLYDERLLSGTSMATPLVSGGIALVYANNKQEIDIVKAVYFWDKTTIPQLFEDSLKSSAYKKGNMNDWGSGIVQFDQMNSNVQAGLHTKLIIGFAGIFIIILIVAFFIYRSRHKSTGYKVPKWVKKL